MISILFVCTGNQFRSPIAAQAFREQLARDGRSTQWHVNSAGTWTSDGLRAPQDAMQLARSMGLDIEGHSTRTLDRGLLEQADVVLVMETGHKESIQVEFPFTRNKVHLLSQVVEGMAYDIPDPAGSRAEARQIITELVQMIRGGAGRIYQLAESAVAK
jgi:protein-tyrosine phosphatase